MPNLSDKCNKFCWLAGLLALILLLSACGGPGPNEGAPLTAAQVAEKIDTRLAAAESALSQLKQALEQGRVRNALILQEYARILEERDPKLKPLVENLAKDAGPQGGLYQNLVKRLERAKNDPAFFESPQARYAEVNAIVEAAKPENFNLALIDVVNVLADMSNGSLPRVEVPPKQETLAANKAEDLGPGSQLIGNPAYGQWVNHNGTSIWEWYGMYAMFRDLVGGRSYSYNQWDRHRDWSYYSDIGRKKYGPRGKDKSYAPSSKKYSRPRDYGVNRKSYGSAAAERRSSTYSKKTNKPFSGFKKSASTPGSFRNRSTYSRGMFGGK